MDLEVNHRGVSFTLNPALVRMKGVDAAGIEAIRAAHRSIIDLRAEAKAGGRDLLRRVAQGVERLEFELQGLWGFDLDASRHTHWLTIPGCTCPVRANQALWGHPVRLIARDCPVFGGDTRDDILLVPTDMGDQPRTMYDVPGRVRAA